MKQSTLYSLYALLLLAAGCTDAGDILPDGSALTGRTVEVTLNLDATRETNATAAGEATATRAEASGALDAACGRPAATRAVDDTDVVPYSTIKNVWVLQFNGTNETTAQLAGAAYIADYTTASVCKLQEGANQTVYFIANTFDTGLRWEPGLTPAELKKRYTGVNGSEASVHGKGATTGTPGDYPNDYTYHLILNGVQSGITITTGTTLTCTLKRNTARVDFFLKNTTVGADAVTIDSVQVCSAMGRNYLITNYTLPDVFPAETTGYLETTNYKPVAWTTGTAAANGYTRFRFYLPANQRGIRNSITKQKDKNEYHQALATRIVIKGTYQQDGQAVPIAYTIYPGANLTTDFNLKPDHAYEYTITIGGRDETDVRIRNYGVRDFAAPAEERANCYILNPAPKGLRRFKIPVDRINIFWGDQGYKNLPANTIGTSDAWTAEVLRCDFAHQNTDPNAGGYFNLVKPAGTGADGATDGYFTAEVSPGTDGNVLVAVKKQGTSIILWSWHLWITDYNPYEASIPATTNGINTSANSSADSQITDVPGGVITRFTTYSSIDGKYMTIMDRCLGQNKARPEAQPRYQFGRKDPFLYNQANGTNLFETMASTTSRINSVTSPTYLTDNGVGANADWLDSAEPRGTDWDDPNLPTITSANHHLKSLFDPCPPGWKVPYTRTQLGPRGYTQSTYNNRIFHIQGVRWIWVYEERCWTSASNAIANVISNSSNFGNTTNNNTTNCARAQLMGIVPQRMKY
ncbi:MAG: DUF4906 domain-containing protein [Mediterranea sp.]|jgi:hypothetical protein|nr:DUF4906 domain-containing protein [Mediterranea sp.]